MLRFLLGRNRPVSVETKYSPGLSDVDEDQLELADRSLSDDTTLLFPDPNDSIIQVTIPLTAATKSAIPSDRTATHSRNTVPGSPGIGPKPYPTANLGTHSKLPRFRTKSTAASMAVCSAQKLRTAGIVSLVSVLGIAVFYRDDVYASLEAFLSWVQSNPLMGAIAYVFVYAISAVFCIPAVILTLGAGYIFTSIYGGILGVAVASVVDFSGAVAGAVASLLTGRLLFYSCVQAYAVEYKQFQVAEKLIQKNGLKVMFLLRVLMPYNLLNYLLAITNVSLLDYTVACFGMVPSSIGWSTLGSTLTALSEVSQMSDKGPVAIVKENPSMLVFGLLFAVSFAFAMGYITRSAKREFQQMSSEQHTS